MPATTLPYYGPPTPGRPTPTVNPFPSYPINFGNVTNRDLFQKGVDTLTPSTNLIGPDTQQILDYLGQQGDLNKETGISNAVSLAARRGLSGSSIEQYGTQEAGAQADQATLGARISVLNEAAKRRQDAQSKLADLYSGRGNTEAQLTSDELASLRNADFSNRYLDLQKQLGQQGIDISRENIDANRDIARRDSRNNLIGNIISGGIPLLGLLGKGGGGGGLFGGGTGAAGTSGLGSLFNFGIGGGGAPLAPGAFGPASPGMFGAGGSILNTAGAATPGLGAILPGLAGYSLGQNVFGTSKEGKIGGIAGGIGGSFFGPAGAGIGAFAGQGLGNAYSKLSDVGKSVVAPALNPVKTVTTIAKSVKKVFPF